MLDFCCQWLYTYVYIYGVFIMYHCKFSGHRINLMLWNISIRTYETILVEGSEADQSIEYSNHYHHCLFFQIDCPLRSIWIKLLVKGTTINFTFLFLMELKYIAHLWCSIIYVLWIYHYFHTVLHCALLLNPSHSLC